MIFQGDLSKYHPADALMFLSQLSLNGVLSVARGQQIVHLTFNKGRLLDAHSAAGDEKIMQVLRFEKTLTGPQEARIRRIRTETGMTVRQVLGELDLVALAQINGVLGIGMSEVLLELFLLEEGTFHFTDTPVEPDSAGLELDTGAAALNILSHADEMRDFEKTVLSLDRRVRLNMARDQLISLPGEQRALAHLAAQGLTVRQLLAQAPFYTHKVMRALERHLSAGTFDLEPAADGNSQVPGTAAACLDPLFGAYKQAFKMLIRTQETVKKVEAVIGFCKKFYDGLLILSARNRQVVHCKSISIEAGGGIRAKSLRGAFGTIDEDPIFVTVQRTGIGFFGRTFSSPLIDRFVQPAPGGECALVPVLNQTQLSMFMFVFSHKAQTGLSPHHFLELLSWLIMPAAAGAAVAAAELPPPALQTLQAPQSAMTQLVGRIEELPALPALASRSLQLLSDPEQSMEAVENSIAHDQALVAKIIKVSNSALYGGFQKVESLRQALTRLGAKTTKSLVLAASARSYFFKGKGMNVWGPLLWQHSIECGLAARRIAAACRFADPELAFIGGLMHDIGKLAILMLDERRFQEIQKLKITEKKNDPQAEMTVLGTSHCELGCLLMQSWRMPEAVQACTRFHHQPADAGEHAVLSGIAAYANHLSHTLGAHPQPEPFQGHPRMEELLQAIDLTPEKIGPLLEAVRSDFQDAELMVM